MTCTNLSHESFGQPEARPDAYWLNGTAYCAGCVECDASPCLGEDEIARSTRGSGCGCCGCCGESFDE